MVDNKNSVSSRMMPRALLFFIFALLFSTARAQVGTWRNHLAYHNVQQIQAAGDCLWVMASNGLYMYNKQDESITTYDKVSGLNDVFISHIKWCSTAKRLIVVYGNTNIDLIETDGTVTNVSDIYRKTITGDKTINNIYVNGQYAYLACGFGVVKLNVKRAEVSESYMFNQSVNAVTISGANIYAQLQSGSVMMGDMTNNLIDLSSWQTTTSYPSFSQDNSDYTENIELVKTLMPGGPRHNYFGYMKFHNGKLYTCNGEWTANLPIQLLQDNEWSFYQSEGISQQTGRDYASSLCFDIDPQNDEHIFAGARNGLYEFLNKEFVNFYNSENSPIEAYNGKSMNTQIVSGVKFDNSGNVWLLVSSAPTTSLIRYANGEFTKLNHSDLMKLNDGGFTNKSNGNLSKIIIDSNNYMWFVNNNGRAPALYKYDMASDALMTFDNFTNQDGTTMVISGDGGVRCCVEDLEGNIWIGTSSGPLMLEKAQTSSTSYHYTQVKVPRNDGTNYADYLLAGIDISSIAIDGAGRKWFGTFNNGAYLISADNVTEVQHFTAENSSLLSNEVQSIAINPSTGEVFFGTGNGLCSYISDATETNTEMTKDNVWAYPNPVNPGYTGPITITGLTLNADVKIMSSNGALVNEGRSNGGTFVWDGCDKSGSRVASGVYMVATATSDGKEGTVCKIGIVR